MTIKKGIFIVLEGVEGTGKGTLSLFLQEELKKRGLKIFITREPGGKDSKVAEKIREVILNQDNNVLPLTEAYLFAASRAQHVREVIIPHLNKGEIVISERYVYASYAYQGKGRGLGIENIKKLNELAIDNVLPDLVIYLDLSPQIGLKRKFEARQDLDRMDQEEIEFYNRVRNAYLNLVKENPQLFQLVDASKPLEEVKKIVLNLVLDKIKKLNYKYDKN
ncbi:MAG: dTMP kinase [Minisyncoccia bacterium]